MKVNIGRRIFLCLVLRLWPMGGARDDKIIPNIGGNRQGEYISLRTQINFYSGNLPVSYRYITGN